MPSFGRRRVATLSISALISAPAPPSVSLIFEDEEVSPHDVDLRPHKRNVIDIGESVLADVDSLEDEIVIQKNTMIFIEKDVRETYEVPQL